MISPEVLRRYAYFTAGGEQALKDVAMIADEVSLEAGKVLFTESDVADTLYVVLDGEVEIRLSLDDTHSVVVDTMVGGDLVGVSTVVGSAKRRATAQAKTPTRLVAIDGAGLQKLCEQNAQLGHRLMGKVVGALAHRLDAAWVQLAAADL